MARAKMGASYGWEGNYVESATASFSLVVGDSGKTFILKDAAVTVTLPLLSDIEAGTVLPLTGHSTITPAAGMIIGDKYDIVSDGTNWYVYVIAGAEVAGS